MADPELEAIRQRRMQELMAQQGAGTQQNNDQQKAQDDAKREADERRQMMLTQLLTPEARARVWALMLYEAGYFSISECNHTTKCELNMDITGIPRIRVARIALVKPDKARGVEDVIIRAAQYGQITEKVSEQKLIELLEQINTQTTKQTKVTIQRRRNVLEDDD
ncbi:putative two-pore potassium channel 3-like [Capsicum annuum]|nr:putative two-pore potassium channel 3-like [Capsicum annuum]